MRTILTYVRPKFKVMGLQLFIKFAGTVVELLLPWMLSHILDEIVPLRDMRGVALWGFYMILCAAGAIVGNVTANRMATMISRDITRKIRHDLFDRISHLSSRQTDQFTIPSLISRLTTDTYNVHQMIDRMQRLGVRAPILLLGGITVTLSMEPVLTLILICTLPILGFVVYTVSQKGIPLYTKVQSAMDAMVRKVQENMTGVRVIKALSKSEYEKARFDEINADVVRKDQHAGMIMAVTNPVMNLLLNGGLTLVVVVGAYRVNAGVTAPGIIIAFLSYFTIILNALMMVTRLFVMYSKGAASAKRLEEVLIAPEDMPVVEAAPVKTDMHVEFDHVSFSYNKVRDNLTDVSFALKRGETLGVIGATGSGKTTIVNLLMRFYDPDKGVVRVNGKDIRSIPSEILHTMYGVAFQNDFLYADTIAENIDFGRGLPESAIERAAGNAQADFIRRRPLGFQDVLTVKGANLSGGQKQRLLIARALAGDPEVLILDDSSSALDYGTDARLRQALSREYKDTTKIVVAQRVSSILHADHILVLEDGMVIGSGRHEELLRDCESYREIYDAQMGDVA